MYFKNTIKTSLQLILKAFIQEPMFIFVKNNGSTLPLIIELTKISMLTFVFLNIQEQLRAPMNVKKNSLVQKTHANEYEILIETYTRYSGVYDEEQKKEFQACKREVLEIRQLLQ